VRRMPLLLLITLTPLKLIRSLSGPEYLAFQVLTPNCVN
jgi:hypothetical protein